MFQNHRRVARKRQRGYIKRGWTRTRTTQQHTAPLTWPMTVRSRM